MLRRGCLPESVGGEACSCQDSREGGFHTSSVLASIMLLGYQKHENCTLGTLTSPRSESVFFASFLCRFGQRNDALPRAVANSDKENGRHITREGLESSNPALIQTADARTWQPAPTPTANPETCHTPAPNPPPKPRPPHPQAPPQTVHRCQQTPNSRVSPNNPFCSGHHGTSLSPTIQATERGPQSWQAPPQLNNPSSP
ncbi:hypothetical protein SBC2_34730 [Caballeronia sp. SBC2]|nr:hypothetical protein SBC2_34730 [Caballeronia sp. SBC2]